MVEVGFHDVDSGLLGGGQTAFFQPRQVGVDQLLDIGQDLFPQFFPVSSRCFKGPAGPY